MTTTGMTEAYFIQATQKHRFSIYIKCQEKHICSLVDLLMDTGYRVDGLSEGYFEVLEERYRSASLHGAHVIVFKSSDGTSLIDERLKSIR